MNHKTDLELTFYEKPTFESSLGAFNWLNRGSLDKTRKVGKTDGESWLFLTLRELEIQHLAELIDPCRHFEHKITPIGNPI